MNSDFFQIRVVFFEFQSFGGVFAVLGGDVSWHSRYAACLLLRAFQNHLLTSFFIFLCHFFLFFRQKFLFKSGRKNTTFFYSTNPSFIFYENNLFTIKQWKSKQYKNKKRTHQQKAQKKLLFFRRKSETPTAFQGAKFFLPNDSHSHLKLRDAVCSYSPFPY